MKKSVLMGLLSLTVCLFTACSSDNDDSNNGNLNTSGEKLVGYTEKLVGIDGSDEHVIFQDFKYDAQGRLIKVTVIHATKASPYSPPFTTIITYSYSPNTIFKQSPEGNVNYTLANGRIYKSVYSNRDQHEICEFTYDNTGQLTRVTSSNDGMTNIIWENGNIVYADGSTFTYTDYPSKKFVSLDNLEYCIPDGVEPILFQQGYFGKYPRNLVKTIQKGSKTINYTYTFDSKGNVLTATNGWHKSTCTWK